MLNNLASRMRLKKNQVGSKNYASMNTAGKATLKKLRGSQKYWNINPAVASSMDVPVIVTIASREEGVPCARNILLRIPMLGKLIY
jgi:hypothetical protein